MKKGDLVTVLTNAGEFVGRLDKNDDTGVHLDNPKMIVNTPEGKMGFARGVCMTAKRTLKVQSFVLVVLSWSRSPIQT